MLVKNKANLITISLKIKNPRSTALDASTQTITPSMRFTLNVNAIIIKIYATKYTILFPTHITCGLLFQSARTNKIQLSMLVKNKANLITISLKINLFSL
jgi:hypothetical protein